MEVEIGRGKKARRAYGFDDIAIVPSRRTRDPDDVDVSWTLGPYRFELPLLASAMAGVGSPDTAGAMGKRRGPRRRRLVLAAGPCPVRAPAARVGQGRCGVAGHRGRHRQAGRPRGPEP